MKLNINTQSSDGTKQPKKLHNDNAIHTYIHTYAYAYLHTRCRCHQNMIY